MDYRTNPTRAKSFEDEVLTPMWKTVNREKLEYAWLLEFVLSMRSARCSDARDKVFAVHGLAAYHCGSSIQAIAPTYTTSTAQVYTKFIGAFAVHTGTLNYLIQVEPAAHRITKDLPSWVPDFQSTYSYNGHKVVVGVGGKLFSEHDHAFSSHKVISHSLDQLCLNAVKIDHIIEVESRVESTRPSASSILLSRLSLCRKIPQITDGHSRIESLWRTTIQNTYEHPEEQFPQRPAPPELATSFSAFALFSFCEELSEAANDGTFEQVFRSIASILRDFKQEVHNKELPTARMVWEAVTWYAKAGEDLIYETRDPQPENGEEGHDWVLWLKKAVGTWMSAVRNAQTSSHHCFLSNGMKLGLASEDVQAGDEIWFAPASSLPLVLRPVDTTGEDKEFRFVSVGYLHDMMDGEALANSPSLMGQMETIVLE